MSEFEHVTVLLEEAVDGLQIQPNGVYVDATLGGGGHTAAILQKLDQGELFGFDQDQVAIEFNKKQFVRQLDAGNLVLVHDNFENIQDDLIEFDVTKVDGILYDLGVSSKQFDDQERGFSYRFDAKLDMRMDQHNPLTAEEIVNQWEFNDLVRIFYRYGDEKYAKQIARKIETVRQDQEIETTFQLVDVIKSALPTSQLNKKGHPAKKVFQALRIAVNHELDALESSLAQSLKMIAPGGRIAVISFQSLEDRIVKRMFSQAAGLDKQVNGNMPIIDVDLSQFQLVNKKPLIPTDPEILRNNRAHSAKLRIIERKVK
jgi:16S rRNA (cytosine1402-N4)-methyltransferase